MDIDRVARIVIANADYGVAFKVKHHRPAGINFRFELDKGKASGDCVVRFLVVAFCNGITSGLVKEFSPISPIQCANPIRYHVVAG
jgi:hypothetical protein